MEETSKGYLLHASICAIRGYLQTYVLWKCWCLHGWSQDNLCVLSFKWTCFAHSISPKTKSSQYHVCLRGFTQAERQSQQQWEKELQDRERRLKQQEEAFQRLSGLEEMIQTAILAVEEVRHTKALPCVLCQPRSSVSNIVFLQLELLFNRILPLASPSLFIAVWKDYRLLIVNINIHNISLCVCLTRNTSKRWASCRILSEREARKTDGSRAASTPSRSWTTTWRRR